MENRNCRQCEYFLNCLDKNNKEMPNCTSFPEAKGYCELWNGPLQNYNPCTGWIPIQQK